MSKPRRKPRKLYALFQPHGELDVDDVFTSLQEAKREQSHALTIFQERLTLRVYKLQPVKR
jgi:hypothetical protein